VSENCEYRSDFDPATEEPRGPACGAIASQVILWRDGRFSPACDAHGLAALDPDARKLVSAVVGSKTPTLGGSEG